MKRFFIIFALLFLGVAAFAQKPALLGLQFGESYSPEEVTKRIQITANKEYKLVCDSVDFGLRVLEYDIEKKSIDLPEINVGLSQTSSLATIMFIYTGTEKERIKKYAEIVKKLKQTYPLEREEPISDGSSNVPRYSYKSEDGFSIELYYDDSEIWLAYTDVNEIGEASTTAILQGVFPTLPTIQDTFLGLKLGNTYALIQIKNALTKKSETVFDSERTPSGYNVSASKVSFGGRIWDFCDVRLKGDTNKGEIYAISFSNNFSYYDYQDEKDAKKLYELYVEKLDEKYGKDNHFAKEYDGYNSGDKMKLYLGLNGIAIELSYRVSKSKGGERRRYVTLYYVDRNLLNSIAESDDAEL